MRVGSNLSRVGLAAGGFTDLSLTLKRSLGSSLGASTDVASSEAQGRLRGISGELAGSTSDRLGSLKRSVWGNSRRARKIVELLTGSERDARGAHPQPLRREEGERTCARIGSWGGPGRCPSAPLQRYPVLPTVRGKFGPPRGPGKIWGARVSFKTMAGIPIFTLVRVGLLGRPAPGRRSRS